MPKLSVWMIRAALLHLGMGFSFGALLLANKGVLLSAIIWRLLEPHIELLIFGWMLQLAMGVAFYALPRHANSKARFGNEALAWLSFYSLNLGIITSGLALWMGLPFWSFVGKIALLVAAMAYVHTMFPRIKAFGS
jgi:hypothetical protein